jgi:hypothetical protein
MRAFQAASIFARIHIEGRFRHIQHRRVGVRVTQHGFSPDVSVEFAEPTPDSARQNCRDTKPAPITGGYCAARLPLPGVDEALQRVATDARLVCQVYKYASRFGWDGVYACDQRTRDAVLPIRIVDDWQVAVIPGQQRAQT